MLRRAGIGERRRERRAMHRLLLDTVDRRWRRDTRDVKDRRRHVDHVRELRSDATAVGHTGRPPHDERVPRAAEMRADLLAPLERRVARPCPRGAIVRIHDRRAPLIQSAEALGQLELHLVGEWDAVLHRQLIERARDRALHACAVVAPDPEHEGVVELAELLDRVQHPAHVVVGVLREARVHLHLPRVERLELVGYVVPCGERRVARSELGVGGDHPELLLSGERLLTELVPALIELALVLVGPRFRDVVWRVTAPGGEVDEERLVRVLRPNAVQPLDASCPPSRRGSSTGPLRRRSGRRSR